MGDIADSIINGDFCEVCNEYLGEGDGFPRTCEGCQEEEEEEILPSHEKITEELKKLESNGTTFSSTPNKFRIKFKCVDEKELVVIYYVHSGKFYTKRLKEKDRGFENLLFWIDFMKFENEED